MMSHAWPIVLRGGMLVAARLRPALRLDDPQPPRAALRRAGAAPGRARHQRRAASGAGAVYIACLAAQLALIAGRARRRAASARARCCSPATTC